MKSKKIFVIALCLALFVGINLSVKLTSRSCPARYYLPLSEFPDLEKKIHFKEAEAIPAWGRRYNADCTMCHTMIPRLNPVGHKFRRLGYRMPDEFDTKAVHISGDDLAKFTNYFSARGRARVLYSKSAGSPGHFSFSEDTHPDVTLFYAGPVTRNISFFFELPFEPAAELEVAQIVLNFGRSDRFFFSRVGQFHQFSRVGYGGLDRPIGLSNPQVFDVLINGFRPRLDNVGVETGYSWGNFTGLVQATNGISANGGAANEGLDPNNHKDIGVLLEYMIPNHDASVSLLYVYGQAPTPQDSVETAVPGASNTKYNRVYAFADCTFESIGLKPLVGGGVGFDNQFITNIGKGDINAGAAGSAALLTAANSTSWFTFLELDQRILNNLYADVRFDYFDPTNKAEAAAATRRTWMGSGGLVWSFQRYLRLTAEYQVSDNAARPAAHAARAEAQLNF